MSGIQRKLRRIWKDGATGSIPLELWVGVLIGLSLLMSAVLAVNAIYLDRSHRSAAESVVRDYAAFAAEQFSARFEAVFVNRVVNPIQYRLRLEGAADPAGTIMSRADLPIDTARGGYGILPQAAATVASTFRFTKSNGPPLVEWTDVPSEAVATWVSDTVAYLVDADNEAESHLAFDARAGSGHFVVVEEVKTDDGTQRGFGYLGTVDEFEGLVRLANSYGPLLPESLTGKGDSVEVAISLSSPGKIVFRQAREIGPDFRGSHRMSDRAGGLLVTAAIDPSAASRLVIGGIPTPRTPAVLGMLILSGLLAIGALLILRRGYALARVRSDFVSGVSHELRTPLAQIRMFAETLKLGRVRTEEERDRSLEIIDHEALRLTHLVENLLKFSRADRGGTRIRPVPSNLAAVVEGTVSTFAPLASQRSVTIRTSCDSTIRAMADPESIQQIVINLLDNAVKYGPDGQTVAVTLSRSEGTAVITVEDEGPGIRESDRNRIWRRFWRSDSQPESAITGTGIGLALVREIAEMHGGIATVTAGAVGARFTVEIPALPIEADGGFRSQHQERPA